VKVQKLKSKVSPFGGISFINDAFNKVGLTQLIDNELGTRASTIGYKYSDIIRNMSNVYLSGGDVIEDVGTHLGAHLKSIPDNKVPSPDTILRGLKELTTENTIYTSKTAISYAFNENELLNGLLIKSLKLTGALEAGKYYDFDYDNQVISNKKYDAKRTYKKTKGYVPGVATIGKKIVYIENRDGNANVKFKQEDTLQRAYSALLKEGIKIGRSRMDAGSYSKAIIEVVAKNSKLFYIRANKSVRVFEQIQQISSWKEVTINYKKYEVASIKFTPFFEDKNYRLVVMREKTDKKQLDLFLGETYAYRTILTNDWKSEEKDVIEYYNQRGTGEQVFDVMNNDFGWRHMPFSFLNENNTFMIITAIIMNFYAYVVKKIAKTFENIHPTMRLKRFVFRFIAVAGKWVYQARSWVLKLYTLLPYDQLVI